MRILNFSLFMLFSLSSSVFAGSYCPAPNRMEAALKSQGRSQLIQSIFDKGKIFESVNKEVDSNNKLEFTSAKIYADVGTTGSWKPPSEKVIPSLGTVICTYKNDTGLVFEITGKIIK